MSSIGGKHITCENGPISYNDYAPGILTDLPPSVAMARDYKNNKGENPITNTLMTDPNEINPDDLFHKPNVTLNVSGTRIEIECATYSKLEPAILSEDTIFQINPTTRLQEVFIQRHLSCFLAVLDFYRFGELHMPSDVCPFVYKRELTYWGLESKDMMSCCLRRYAAFHCNEKTLRNCTLQVRSDTKEAEMTRPTTRWGRFRAGGWKILDDPKSSIFAKIYLAVASFFVILSIFLLAASSDPNFTRKLTPEEWNEILSDDEIDLFWDRIYPPGSRSRDFYMDRAGFQTTTTRPIGTNSAPSGSKVGKRSVPDDARYSYQNQPDSTKPDTSETDLNSRGENTNLKQKTKDTKWEGDDKGKLFEGHDTEAEVVDKNSKMLSKYLSWGVEKILQSFKESKSPEGVKRMTRKIVDRAMQNHRQNIKDVLNGRRGVDIIDDREEKYSTKSKEEYSYDAPERNIPGESFHGQRRLKRSANNPNSSRSNVTQPSQHENLTDLFEDDCIYLSGEALEAMADAFVVSSQIIAEDDAEPAPLPSAQNMYEWLNILEYMCIAYFTAEFVLRFIFSPEKLQHLFSFFTWMDFIALATMYIMFVTSQVDAHLKYKPSLMDTINCLQIARAFRFFRLVKNVVGFRVLVLSIRTSWRELLLLLLYIFMAVTIFGTMVYFCERDNMKTIAASSWWAIVTMTTVGYGDITPKTLQGRLTGVACALSGVLLIAVTVPIFVNNFILFYEHSTIAMESDFYESSNRKTSKENDKVNDAKLPASHSDKGDLKAMETQFTSTKNEGSHSKPVYRNDSGVSSSASSFLPNNNNNNNNNNQAFQMERPVGNYGRTDSSKSLISRTKSTNSIGSLDGQSEVSISKVTPFVQDLDEEEEEIDLGTNRKNKRKKQISKTKTKNHSFMA